MNETLAGLSNYVSDCVRRSHVFECMDDCVHKYSNESLCYDLFYEHVDKWVLSPPSFRQNSSGRPLEVSLEDSTALSRFNFKCNDTSLHRLLMGHAYFVLLIICIAANTLNIVVYQVPYLKSCLAVKLLAVKAVFNMLFMASLLPMGLRAVYPSEPVWEREYVYATPYILWISNVFGTISIWLIVLMTFERWLYVKYPLKSRAWCSVHNFGIAGVLLVPFSVALHCDWYRFLEWIYNKLNLILVVLIPLILLVYFSVDIAWRLLYTQRHMLRHVEEKRCVTTVTLLTTAAYVLLEAPAFGYMIRTNFASSSDQFTLDCTWQVISHFMAVCEASVLFFIYVVFSSRFRELFVARMLCRQSAPQANSQNDNNQVALLSRNWNLLNSTEFTTFGSSFNCNNNNDTTQNSMKPVKCGRMILMFDVHDMADLPREQIQLCDMPTRTRSPNDTDFDNDCIVPDNGTASTSRL